jgi:peptidoglycan/LPS O-acetylase OafA/YrhL
MAAPRTRPALKNELGGAASVYLDVLRALASNLVIAAHVLLLYFHMKDPYSLGNLGVATFFLLSGFLITQSMLNWAQRPQPHFPGFFADRVARIFTPYVPALLLVVAANLLLIRQYDGSEDPNTGVLAFFGNLLMLQDHAIFQFLELLGFDGNWRVRSYNAAEPFWTVAIEMWIYVAMGLFFFCLLRRERIDRRYLVVLALVSLPVFVWNAAAGGGKSLTLIWLLGSVAGYLFYAIRHTVPVPTIRALGYGMIAFGAIGFIGRAGKVGFQPYDLQSAALLASSACSQG